MSIPSRYEFRASIGEGYFARVASYADTASNTLVAIKRLKPSHHAIPDSVHRFRKEVELLQELGDVNGVMPLLGVIDQVDELAYVMPLGSKNLHTFIKRRNADLALQDRVRIFDQILHTMRNAHERGVLHRDVSPRNVIVFGSDETPAMRLCDFGLGKSLNEMTAYTATSAAGWGHAYYVAPEQIESLKVATVRSDIHAMGRLLNFIMTGKDPDRHYPCDFSVVIRKATHAEPSGRYSSLSELEEVYDQLKRLLFSEPAESGRLTLAALTIEDEIDWHEFHELAISFDFEGHVYYGYIKPIVNYLLQGDRITRYYAAVGNDISRFVETLVRSFDACIGTTGWPFSETGTFGRILGRLLLVVQDEEVQTMCACELWDLAYGADQWDVQTTIERLFRSRQMPKGIEASLAHHILHSGSSVDSEKFSGMPLPVVIRNAIASLQA